MSAISNFGSAATATRPNGFADISSEQFVKIMMSELTNQDPLKPNDASHLLEQMSSLRQIESSMSLSGKLEALVSQNQFATAGGMLGAAVSGVTELGVRAEGLVVSVTRGSGGPVLILQDGQRINFNNIDEVFIPAPFTNPPSPTPPPPAPNVPVNFDGQPIDTRIPAPTNTPVDSVPAGGGGSNV